MASVFAHSSVWLDIGTLSVPAPDECKSRLLRGALRRRCGVRWLLLALAIARGQLALCA